MTIYVYIAQSLDGYIAGKHGELDWLNDIPNPDHSDFGFADFMNRVDALVMGRNTFEVVQTFDMWPYTKPVYVISTTLNALPPAYAGKAKLLNLKPVQIVEKLKQDGLNNLYVDGGTLIQSFLAKNLIDELIITTIPVLLGGGIPLFGELSKSLALELVKSEVLVNSLVKNHYRVLR